MDKSILIKMHEEYKNKYELIINEYSKKDGLVIEGKIWWDYYKILINNMLDKIKSNSFTENDASYFYKKFGWAPKLHAKPFIETGIEKISKAFIFLADENISANKKIKDIVEEPESDNYIKGIGINFVTLFLTTYYKFITKDNQFYIIKIAYLSIFNGMLKQMKH